MPMYEYACNACGKRFEALVRSQATTPACPSCESQDLKRLISVPGIKSETTAALAMRDARARDRQLTRDRTRERLEYERSHHRHG